MINDDCNKCYNFSLYPYSTTCIECGGSPKSRKSITNADRIRSMSDEELAEWVWGAESDGRAYGPWGKNAWLDWLRQEAET